MEVEVVDKKQPPVLDAPVVADLLGVSKRCVQYWFAADSLPWKWRTANGERPRRVTTMAQLTAFARRRGMRLEKDA